MGVLYEHWRLDTNECFYIGKSMGKNPYKRAYNLSPRNNHHKNIVNLLDDIGLIEVRTSEFPGITKKALNNLEVLAIAHWKMYVGNRLTNVAKGGDGGVPFNHDDGSYEKFCLAVKEGHARRSEENKLNATVKRFETLNSRSEEEKITTSKKRSKSISDGYAAQTPEKKLESSLKRSAAATLAHASKSPEKKKADGEAIRLGWLKKKSSPGYVKPFKWGRLLYTWHRQDIKPHRFWGS
jgi:hypothetical protein